MHPIVLFTFKFEGTAIQVAGADLDAGDAQRLRFFEGRGRLATCPLAFLGTRVRITRSLKYRPPGPVLVVLYTYEVYAVQSRCTSLAWILWILTFRILGHA